MLALARHVDVVAIGCDGDVEGAVDSHRVRASRNAAIVDASGGTDVRRETTGCGIPIEDLDGGVTGS